MIEHQLISLFEKILPGRSDGHFFLSMPSTMLISKEKALEAGLFDIRLNPNYGEDLDFGVRMFLVGDFVILKESLAIYRKDSPDSLSKRRSSEKVRFLYTQGNKLHFVLWELFNSRNGKNIDAVPAFRKMATFHLRLAGKHFLRYANGAKAGRSLLFRAWRYTPAQRGALVDWLKSLFPATMHPRLFWFESHRSDLLPAGTDRSFAEQLFQLPPVWIDEKENS